MLRVVSVDIVSGVGLFELLQVTGELVKALGQLVHDHVREKSEEKPDSEHRNEPSKDFVACHREVRSRVEKVDLPYGKDMGAAESSDEGSRVWSRILVGDWVYGCKDI